MADLITLADAKTHLNMTTSTNDTELAQFISAASEIVERRSGVTMSATFTEVLYGRVDASGIRRLVLGNRPVISVTSITSQVTGMPSYDVSTVTGNLDAGIIYLSNWWQFYGPLNVVYVAGRASVPPSLALATKILVAHFWRTQRGAMPLPAGGGEQMSGEPGYEGLPIMALELMDESKYDPIPGVA